MHELWFKIFQSHNWCQIINYIQEKRTIYEYWLIFHNKVLESTQSPFRRWGFFSKYFDDKKNLYIIWKSPHFFHMASILTKKTSNTFGPQNLKSLRLNF